MTFEWLMEALRTGRQPVSEDLDVVVLRVLGRDVQRNAEAMPRPTRDLEDAVRLARSLLRNWSVGEAQGTCWATVQNSGRWEAETPALALTRALVYACGSVMQKAGPCREEGRSWPR
jgi:hypothetical protein